MKLEGSVSIGGDVSELIFSGYPGCLTPTLTSSHCLR